jgi:hypothetical protein
MGESNIDDNAKLYLTTLFSQQNTEDETFDDAQRRRASLVEFYPPSEQENWIIRFNPMDI